MNNTRQDDSLIIGEQLQKARFLLQLTPEDVAQQLGVEPRKILEWEIESARPSLDQLERLSVIYGRELDYFLRETPAPPVGIEFRGRPSTSLRDLPNEAKIVLGKFDELCRAAVELEGLLGRRRELSLLYFDESVSPENVSQVFRKELGADSRPLRRLRDRVEALGIRVFALAVPQDAFSGLSFLHSEYGPCVLLNARDLPGRRNFTLAHELAHLIYRQGSSVCYIPPSIRETYGSDEYRANQFAVELLLPSQSIIEDFRGRGLSEEPTEQELSRMASGWGVSLQALGYRLETLGLIKRGLTDTIFNARPKYLKRAKIPRWERQLGRSFVAMAFEAYQRGLISSGRLAHVLGLTVRKALEEAGKRTS